MNLYFNITERIEHFIKAKNNYLNVITFIGFKIIMIKISLGIKIILITIIGSIVFINIID